MRASGYLALAVAIVGASTGCGDPKAEGRRPELRAEFAADGSGAADWLIDFGDVPLGSTGVQAIELRNVGAIPLLLQSEQVGAPFVVERLGEGIEIAPGGATTVLFRFEPVEAAQEQIILTIFSNEEGGGVERSLRLVGGGLVPALRCTPRAIDFAQVPRGISRVQRTVCTNPLSVELELAELKVRGHFAPNFRARTVRGESLPFQLRPEATIEIEIEVLSETLGMNQATLVLQDGGGETLAELRLSAEVAVSALEIEPAGCLAFGYVAEGEKRTEVLRLKARGAGAVEVSALRFKEDSQGAFSVEATLPVQVPAGSDPPAELRISFAPSRPGMMVGSLELLTRDELGVSGEVSICLSGFGGGPKLRCDEEAIDFGAVAMDEPASRRFHCSNQGTAPPGVPIDPVFISDVSTNHPAFTMTLLGPDGAPAGPHPQGYAIGEGFDVEVVFSPLEEAVVIGELQFRTSGGLSDVYAIPLSGDGRRHLPCSLSVEPMELNFGTIERETEAMRRIRIENLNPSSCWIESLRLSEESDSYSLQPIEGLSLEGSGEQWIEVSFAPTRYKERFEGQVEIRFLGEDSPRFVGLRGRSARPCLVVEPSPLDFGSAIPGCASRQMSATIRNVCEEPLKLLEIGLEGAEGTSSFRIEGLPSLPQVIQANATLDGSFRFVPTSEGVREGSFFMSVDAGVGDRDTYVSGLRGLGNDGLQTDRFSHLDRPKVDVLWVVDNTSAPDTKHRWKPVLTANLAAFLSVAERENVDFNLAVTTSQLEARGSCPPAENGRFFPIDGSSPRILKPNTPNLEEAWMANLDVGTCGSWRTYYEAAFQALSEPLISVDKDPRYQDENEFRDGNAGFLRPDASLSIIFVADGTDVSGTYGKTPAGYLAFFRGLKGGDHDRFRAHAITIRRSTDSILAGGNCLNNDSVSDRLMSTVDATGGAWLDICVWAWNEGVWLPALERLSEAVFADTRRLSLRGWPADRNGDGRVDSADLLLEVDGVSIPAIDPITGSPRWSFDPVANELRFAKGASPPADADIGVTYRLGCAESR